MSVCALCFVPDGAQHVTGCPVNGPQCAWDAFDAGRKCDIFPSEALRLAPYSGTSASYVLGYLHTQFAKG